MSERNYDVSEISNPQLFTKTMNDFCEDSERRTCDYLLNPEVRQEYLFFFAPYGNRPALSPRKKNTSLSDKLSGRE